MTRRKKQSQKNRTFFYAKRSDGTKYKRKLPFRKPKNTKIGRKKGQARAPDLRNRFPNERDKRELARRKRRVKLAQYNNALKDKVDW